MIFNLSNGLTTVRDAAPAIPPAMKYDESCGLSQEAGCFFSFSFSWSAIFTVCTGVSSCCLGWVDCCGDVMM